MQSKIEQVIRFAIKEFKQFACNDIYKIAINNINFANMIINIICIHTKLQEFKK